MLTFEVSVLIFLMLALFIMGVPIAFVLSAVGVVGILFRLGLPGLYQFAWQFWGNSTNFLYICVALYIYMAVILGKGQVGSYIYDLASKLLRRMPGGLGISTIAASATFSALSGTSVATTATVGIVAYPEMSKRGYPKRITMGALSAGGGLGMLIPPSIPLIIYGAVTGESIGKLFIAGIIPGILLAVLYSFLIAIRAWRGEIKVIEDPTTWNEKFESFKKAFWGLLIIPIVIGGLYAGYFTPTESGAIGVALALVVSIFKYRTLKRKDFIPVLMSALVPSIMIYTILLGAAIFNYMITLYGFPAMVTDWSVNLGLSPLATIFILNLIFLLLGCFVDAITLMLITIPLVYPVITSMGFDGIWFGIMLMINFNMAVETPPVGLNLYVLKGIAEDVSLSDIIKGVLPFYFCEIAGLLLVILFPILCLWLPAYME